MRATFVLLLTALAVQVRAGSLTESACGVIAADQKGIAKVSILPSLHVLTQTQTLATFSLPQDAPVHVEGVMCGRSSLVPSINDYKVLAAGFPLHITTNAETPQRLAVLELVKGKLQYRMLEGRFTSAEEKDLQPILDAMQVALDTSPSESNQRLERP